jgi:hypothetical protein
MKQSDSGLPNAFHHMLREIYAPVAPTHLAMKLQRAGITAEGLRPYRRFLRALFDTATRTYLGGVDGIAYSTADRLGHFSWCLDQAAQLSASQGDGCRYLDNPELLDYLREFLHTRLYQAGDVPSADQLDVLLNLERVQANCDLDELIELWHIFEATPRKGRRLKPASTKRSSRV